MMVHQNDGLDVGMPQGHNERRRCGRVKISSVLAYKVRAPWSLRMDLGDRAVDAISADIGEMGIGVFTDYQFPVGAMVTLRFNLFNEAGCAQKSRRMEIQGKVCYCIKTPDHAFRFGSLFSGISHEDRLFIARFVNTNATGQAAVAA